MLESEGVQGLARSKYKWVISESKEPWYQGRAWQLHPVRYKMLITKFWEINAD